MNPKNVRDKYKEDEIYRAIGQFAVKFEHVVLSLLTGIRFLLHRGGLVSPNLANVMLAGLTAEQLKSILQAMIPEFVVLDQRDERIVKEIFKKVVNIIEKRNDIIHRSWLVGWPGVKQTEFSKVHGSKFKRGKKGIEFKPVSYTVMDFDSLSAECDYAVMLIDRLAICVQMERKISTDVELSKV